VRSCSELPRYLRFDILHQGAMIYDDTYLSCAFNLLSKANMLSSARHAMAVSTKSETTSMAKPDFLLEATSVYGRTALNSPLLYFLVNGFHTVNLDVHIVWEVCD